MIYKDESEEGQKKVRAILSCMRKKGLEFKSGSKHNSLSEFLELDSMVRSSLENKSFISTIPTLRKKKTLSSSILWMKRFNVRMIAVILYGNHGTHTQNKVYAHISKFKHILRELRKVGVAHSTNKSCDPQNFSNPTANASFEPKNHNFHAETTTMGVNV